LDVVYYLIVVIFLSSLINATFGFGFALISMPLLTLVIDLSILGPLIPLLFLAGSAIIVIRNWRQVQFRSTLTIVATAMVVIPVGVYLGKYGDGRLIKSMLGIAIILFAVHNLLLAKRRPFRILHLIPNNRFFAFLLGRNVFKIAAPLSTKKRIRRKQRIGVPQPPRLKNDQFAPVFGVLAGLFGGAYNITGPPIVIYGTLRNWSPQTFRATLQFCFLLLTLIIIASHLSMGSYQNPLIFTYFLYAFPSMIMAVPLGRKINNAIKSPEAFNKYVYILMLLSGLVLFYKALLS